MRVDVGIPTAEASVEKQRAVAKVDDIAEARLHARLPGGRLLARPDEIAEVDSSDLPHGKHAANPTTQHLRSSWSLSRAPRPARSRAMVRNAGVVEVRILAGPPPEAMSTSEETLEHRGHGLRVDRVWLAFEGEALTARNACGDRIRRLLEEIVASTRGHEDRLSDRGKTRGRREAISQAGRVVGQGVRDRLQRGPHH